MNFNDTITNLGRASISVKQSVDDDVLNMLRNSDKLTWETLDLIKRDIIKEINNQNNKIDEISAQISTLELPLPVKLATHSNSHSLQSTSQSPLIDSIKIDIMDEINGKIDRMNNKIVIIDSKIDNITTSNQMEIKEKINKIDDNIMNIDNKIDNIATPHRALIDAANSLALNLNLNSSNDTEVIPNSMLLAEISEVENKSLKLIDEDQHSDTLTNTTMQDLNDSESILFSSLLNNSIQDISVDNIDGKEAAAPTSMATSMKSVDQLSSKKSTEMPTRELYLSKLPVNISEADVKNYIMAKGGLNMDDILVTRLVKKDADLSLFSFISFKIDTNEDTYNKLIDKRFWPEKCVIKDFVRKTPKSAILNPTPQAENFFLAASRLLVIDK